MLLYFSLIALGVTALYGLLADNGILIRKLKKQPVTLYLRKCATNPSPELPPGSNIFAVEFSYVFAALVHILDYAVMRYVDSSVPLLVEQEHQHARMHIKGIADVRAAQPDQFRRFKPLFLIVDTVLLRMGRTVGTAVALSFETIGTYVFSLLAALPAPFCNDVSDLVVFHGFEEAEHGVVTVQCLRPQTNFFVRLVTYPICCVLFAVFLLGPVVTKLLSDPLCLLTPRTYVDLVRYLATYTLTILVVILILTAHYLPPSFINAVGETKAAREMMMAPLGKLMAQRPSLKCEIVKSEAYQVYM